MRAPEVSTIYRSLHSPPMLAGLPVHLLFLVMAVGSVGVFGVMGLVSKTAGLGTALSIAAGWALLAYAYAQDRVRIPLLLLRFGRAVSARISSYSPGRQQVIVRES